MVYEPNENDKRVKLNEILDTGNHVIFSDVLKPQKFQISGLHCFSKLNFKCCFYWAINEKIKIQHNERSNQFMVTLPRKNEIV